MQNKKIEILAPAGSLESVIAAVRSGADAVYAGEKVFSARTSAKNFNEDELKRAVAYCHIHGVKLYVTINTIVFDDEFDMLKEAIITAAKADADALIVHNMGVARLAKQLVPDMALHASTQMSVHTASGVRALYELGFKRVVLAREMSRKEIAECAEIPIELEVFVHGALCMCVSGQCYFSAMLGSRSGNRGACAQTCRLPFSVGNSRGGYALSLKDNSLISHIGELENMGIASAKIEGRMKRPEYVSAAVRACLEQRDNGFVSEKTASELKGVFSRTGFTDGYFTGRLGKEMFGTRTKNDVVSADEKLLSSIRQSYKDEICNVAISGKFSAHTGKNPVLTVCDGIRTVEIKSDIVCEKAVNKPLSADRCTAQLSKTGGTAYRFDSLETEVDEDISLPLSELNRMRRESLAQLDKHRSSVHNYTVNSIIIEKKRYVPELNEHTRACVKSTKLSKSFMDCSLVFVPLFSDVGEIKRLKESGYKIGVEVPRGMFGRESLIEKRLDQVKQAGVKDVLCHNIGALYLAKKLGLTMHGGFGLNFANTYDLLWAEEYGITDAELSFELTFDRINALGGRIPRGIITYGYLPLMLTRNCPNKSMGLNCKSCKNQSKMTDRKGKKFFLRCDGTCVEVLNCVPLYIAEEEFLNLSTSFHTLHFNVENSVETVENIRNYIPNPMLKDKLTRGLYKRGVE